MKTSHRTLQLINPTAKPYVALTPTLVSPHQLNHQQNENNKKSSNYYHDVVDDDVDVDVDDHVKDKYHTSQVNYRTNTLASFPPSSNNQNIKDHIIDLSSSISCHSSKYDIHPPLTQSSPPFSRLAPLPSLEFSSRPTSMFPHHTHHWQHFSERRPILAFSIRLLIVIFSSALLLAALVWSLLPPLDPKDLPNLRIPTSFDALKKLNTLLQIYKTENYYRVLSSFVFIYLFLQTFSLPGSMYLSILAGAMFGVQVALPLVSLCVGTGAMLCYLMSLNLASGLVVHSPSIRNRLDEWKIKLSSKTNKFDLFSYMVVIRISPLPPHWVVNLLAPHVGIPLVLFWFTTCIGILPVTLIHTQLGTTLDQMVGPEDLSFLTTKNLTGLSLVAIGVMIPVLIRWYLRKDLHDLCINHPTATIESRPFSSRSIGLRLESNDSIDNQNFTTTTPGRPSHRFRNPSSQTFDNLLNTSTTTDSSFSSLNKLNSLDSTETLLLSSHHHHTSSPGCFLKSSSSHHHQPHNFFSKSAVRKPNQVLINKSHDDEDDDDEEALLLETKIDNHTGRQQFNRLVLEDEEDVEDDSIEEIKFKKSFDDRFSAPFSSATTPMNLSSENQHHFLVNT